MLSSSPLEAFQQEALSGGSTKGHSNARASAIPPAEKIAFLLQMADRFERDGNVTEAIKSAETALLTRKAMSLEENPSSCGPNTAELFPEPMYKQALALIQKCNGIAVGEFQSGRYDTALFLLNKALFLSSAAADTNCFGMHEHDRLRLRAATLNNLGCLEKRREHIGEALNYLQSAVEIETLVDPDVGASPSTCLNLCTLFNKVGRHDEAVAAAERAITALHFQSQQGHEHIPHFINMLMVAYYNMGVSVECAGGAVSISRAIEAYSRTVEIHREHIGHQPNATADAAADALRRLRAVDGGRQPSGTLITASTSPLPPIERRGLSASASAKVFTAMATGGAMATLGSLARLAPLSQGVPSAILNVTDRLPRPPTLSTGPTSSSLSQPIVKGEVLPRPPSSALVPPSSMLGDKWSRSASRSHSAANLPASERLKVSPTPPPPNGSAPLVPRRPSLNAHSGTMVVLESAAGLGDAAMKHASRMQAKARRREEESERAAIALVKAQRAHKRDKETQRKKEEEQESRRRDELAEVLYNRMVESMRTEEVRRAQHAACKITALWRGYITRKYMLILVFSVIKIQALVRSALCRVRLTAEREEAHRQEVNAAINFKRTKAAIVLQTHVRRFLRRLAIIRRYKARKLREYHSAKLIQQGYRDYQHRKQEAIEAQLESERIAQEEATERLNAAARKIQGMYRTFKSRRFARLVRREQKRRVDAATLIQSQMRGCLARQWFKHYRLYRRQEAMTSAASIRSITKIQRAWRIALAKMKLATLRSQSMILARNQRLNRAALVIQCALRCFFARRRAEPLRSRKALEERSAVKIQSVYRGFAARQMYLYRLEWERKQRSAVRIQQWVRATYQRVRERELRRAGFQKKLAERAALVRTRSAMCIQTYCHSAISRAVFIAKATAYLKLAQHAVVLQSVGRRYLAGLDMATLKRISVLVAMQEQRHAEMTKAAETIQRKFREYQAKCILDTKKAERSSAILIQSAWRMHTARVRCDHLRMERQQANEEKALGVIQRAGREYLKKKELKRLEDYHIAAHKQKMHRLRREEAATQIQSVWRGVATRAAVNEAKGRLKHTVIETMRIQRAWRAYKFRTQINAHIQRKTAQKSFEHGAATKIQSFWRMVIAKEYVSLVREKRFYQTVCAITIQCAWRCHHAKNELETRRRKRAQHQEFLSVQHDGWVQAVTVITMHARTYLDQQLRRTLTEAYLKERVYQRERARVARVHRAATLIQSRYRGYYERAYVRGLRREKHERDAKAAAKFARETRAAEIIQRAFRSMCARVAANKKRVERKINMEAEEVEKMSKARPEDVVKQLFWQHEALIKKNILRTQAERHERLFKAAAKIQSVVRMFLARCTYIAELERLARLEAHRKFEMAEAEREVKEKARLLATQTNAAVRIQTIVRAFLVRRRFKHRMTKAAADAEEEERCDVAATRIQAAWRGYSARCLAGQLRQERYDLEDAVIYFEAARMIQKFYRGHLVRKRLDTHGVMKRRQSVQKRSSSARLDRRGQQSAESHSRRMKAPPAALF